MRRIRAFFMVVLAGAVVAAAVVAFQRATFTRVTAQILEQRGSVAHQGRRGMDVRASACVYRLRYAVEGQWHEVDHQAGTACERGHGGEVVVLVNPRDPGHLSLDFGLDPDDYRGARLR